MILTILFNKLKSLVLLFINLFRRALCCFRARRNSENCESVQLTHVISNSGDSKNEYQTWSDTWEDNVNTEPKTVQEHIDLYRKRQEEMNIKNQESSEQEENLNFFEDMTPRITKQTKILVNTSSDTGNGRTANRLNFIEDTVNLPTAELEEWEDNSGWENENLDTEAQRVLREKKRQERERRAWEYQQKRQEKFNRSLGTKLST